MSTVANEYGKALYALSDEEGLNSEILGQVRNLIDVLDDNPGFIKVLSFPSIPASERMGEIDKVFGGQINSYLLSTLKLLVKRGHAGQIPDVLREYEKIWYERSGIAVAHVVSAVPLSKEQKNALLAKLEKKTGRDVELIFRIDPEVIGGVSVSIDGELLEDTVRSRIDRMKRTLSEKTL